MGSLIRSVVAVTAGYTVFGISAVLIFAATGRDPHATAPIAFMVLSTLYGMAFATASGFLAAVIAGKSELGHAQTVSGIIALGALISIFTTPAGGTLWSQLAALILMAPSASLAGLWRSRPRF